MKKRNNSSSNDLISDQLNKVMSNLSKDNSKIIVGIQQSQPNLTGHNDSVVGGETEEGPVKLLMHRPQSAHMRGLSLAKMPTERRRNAFRTHTTSKGKILQIK